MYASEHQDKVEEIILLGSYSTVEQSLPILSVIAENDNIVNHEHYEKNKELEKKLTEKMIKGGNHSNFGLYGFQKGDNEATIDA